jgi:amidophosphoribosyltransferase
MHVAAMCEFIHADSLAFVSIDGLYRAVGLAGRNNACPQYCDACYTGDYPTRLTDLGERHRSDAQLPLPVDA